MYRTRSLRDASSWRYDGLLCTGDGGTGALADAACVKQLRSLLVAATAAAALDNAADQNRAATACAVLVAAGTAAVYRAQQ